jgi:hypothetical protein
MLAGSSFASGVRPLIVCRRFVARAISRLRRFGVRFVDISCAAVSVNRCSAMPRRRSR